MKQQTAVEWLQDNWLNEQFWNYEKIDQWFKQAKEMEKQQIIKSNRDGVDMVVDKKPFIMGEDYYNKTYLNNNEIGIMTPENHIDVLNEVVKKHTSSQTEISDEEINKVMQPMTGMHEFYKAGFVEGACWYREQLKKKQ